MSLLGVDAPGHLDKSDPGAVWDCSPPGVVHDPIPNIATGSMFNGSGKVYFSRFSGTSIPSIPDEAGVRVGGSSSNKYLVLTVHFYAGPGNESRWDGDKGVVISFARDDAQHAFKRVDALNSLTEQGLFPARHAEHVENKCLITSEYDLHPYGIFAQGHFYINLTTVWKVDGKSGEWSLIAKLDPLFVPQSGDRLIPINDTSLVLKKGDSILSRCHFYNPLDNEIDIE